MYRRKPLIGGLTALASIAAASSGNVFAAGPPAPYGPLPNARQVEWYNREIIAFFHFGINTFGDNVNEGDGTASPAIFNPTQLDCNQWMHVLKNAGIPCGILVAKHADGFCNWPSAYTDYSVKYSPWKNGKGDVVREFTDAAKTAGIKAGLYLGPHDRHEKTYGTPAYADYYANQLTELLSYYGPIWEVWWDGAGADDLTTPMYTRWAEIVRRLQPQCVIFGTKKSYPFADCRWVGNESGHAGDPCWSAINPETIHVEIPERLNSGELDGTMYSPAESDVSIRPSWFYHANEDDRVKTVPELIDLYCNTVGHNSVLLLNFPPDRHGLIYDTDAKNAAGLHHWIQATFKHNLLKGATVTALHTRGPEYSPDNLVDDSDKTYFATTDDSPTDTITFDLHKPKMFDCLMLQEVIELGQRTTGWSVDYSNNGSDWTTIPEASNKQCIGRKWIVRFNPITASHVRLRITSGRASVALHTFGVYKQP
jgi:alpha-L-fucosidase